MCVFYIYCNIHIHATYIIFVRSEFICLNDHRLLAMAILGKKSPVSMVVQSKYIQVMLQVTILNVSRQLPLFKVLRLKYVIVAHSIMACNVT